MDLSKNFSQEEFSCPCCGLGEVDSFFIERLQQLRDSCGWPFGMNSGYRCAKYNESEKIGGKKTSLHTIGKAGDISTLGWTSAMLYEFLKHAINVGFKGIGIGKTYIHLDTRSTKSKMWVY